MMQTRDLYGFENGAFRCISCSFIVNYDNSNYWDAGKKAYEHKKQKKHRIIAVHTTTTSFELIKYKEM